MIINAENLVVGRLATVAAKNALLGENVDIVNCEKAVISGSRKKILSDFERKMSMGVHTHGPFHYRISYKVVRRIIRGMLPHRQSKGREALKRIKCYNDIPKEFEGKSMVELKEANVGKMRSYKYLYIGDICKFLRGGK